ncbi:MAG: hypothetical protein EA408_00145 [Marinilabiliales bacterium]|nr:MAG: hypothetical protein EA408_00145 [Marinilabiliales bacterium]
MENLIIEQRGQFIFRRVLGALMIALAVVSLIADFGSLETMDVVRVLFFLCFGVFFFTPFMGSVSSKVEILNGSLKIKWDGWIKTVVVHESDIERIIVRKDSIKIVRREEKTVKILLHLMGRDRRIKVYKFFTEYARQKDIELVR